jgi:carbon storage regulator
MLVLERKLNERVIINEDVSVEVVAIIGNKIRLGITAPKQVTVHREEVWLEIRKGKDAKNVVGN